MEFTNPQASLVCAGSELLRGKINTHVSTLARRLASVGIDLAEEHTIGDELISLTRVIREALTKNSIVIVTGGLGPTFDDLSREAAASACGRSLVLSPPLLKELERKFKKARYKKMPPANQRQACLVEGAEPIANAVGTAPGQWLALKRGERRWVKGEKSLPSPFSLRLLILLPGPPSELSPMLERHVLPKLKKAFPSRPLAEAHLHFVGVPESVVDDKIRAIINQEKGVQFTILAHLGLVDFDIFVSAATGAQAQSRAHRIAKRIRKKMGRAFYGMDDDYPLEKVVGEAFIRKKATLAAAESCTGGMLAKLLTDIPGSSKYFLGGIVSYSNAVKNAVLGVPQALLQKYGAVSKEVAAAMAQGAREKLGSTWGISITGIAGPDGGTPSKPVGLVYIALAGPRTQKTHEFHFRGTRDAIRQRTVIAALDLLRQIYL